MTTATSFPAWATPATASSARSKPVQPVYETRRLRLMPAGPELAGAAADYYRRNRTFLAAFEPAREESFFTQEGQRSLLTEEARLAEEDRSYRFYISLRVAPERIVGLVGLNNLVRGAFQSCFLGYKLDGGLLRLPGAEAPSGGGQHHAPEHGLPGRGPKGWLPGGGAGRPVPADQRGVGGPHPHGPA